MHLADPLLSITGLAKTYAGGGEPVRAVDGVDLELRRGEFVAVMGASGSGKSTLLHLIAGLCRADAGIIRFDGVDLCDMDDRQRTYMRRNRIGLVFQSYNLIADISGRDNIRLPALIAGIVLPADEPDAIIDALGIAACSGRMPGAMSGGEQQRVAIARALVMRPELLLADEPSGNLDSVASQSLCALLRDRCDRAGTAIAMVTHNPVAAFIADRVVVMRDGRIVDDGPRARFVDAVDLGRHCARLFAPPTAPGAR